MAPSERVAATRGFPRLGTAVVCAAALLVGCGQSDEDKARESLKAYWTALAKADGDAACRQVHEPLRQYLAGLEDGDCGAAMKRLDAAFKEDRDAAARRAKATYEVKVDGKTATATEPGGACAILVEEGDEWKVAEPRCRS